ncbi:hypothetical protein SDC9_163112 [bioreactor metagenome]|uniref:Uncharacterized protein n=1 Tax=bioreactor metagenome TaxID=1076179 RepID=A0A645FQ00_9ZZZZ
MGVLLIVSHHRRTTDNERSPCLINQDRVHFIDDREIVAALDLFFLAQRHAVVAQIIEAKLGVGSVGDVTAILLAPNRWRLVMENAADRQAKIPVNSSHPFAIAGGQVIIHGDHVHTPASQRIQIDGHGRHQRFAFAGGHFGNPSRVQRITSDELNVKRNHFPLKGVFSHHDFAAAKPAAGILYHRKCLGKNLTQAPRQFIIILDFRKLFFPDSSFLSKSLFRKLL